MTERDNYQDMYTNQAALRRFEADLHYASSPFELYSAFTNYLALQFAISEEASMGLYAEAVEKLPSVDLFEEDPELAIEQMRLALIRVVVPMAEALIDSDEAFRVWLAAVIPAAIGGDESRHTPDVCLVKHRGATDLACPQADNCPVRVTKYDMAIDCFQVDYEPHWISRKKERVLIKLAVAERLGLFVPEEAATLRKQYLYRLRSHEQLLAETDEI